MYLNLLEDTWTRYRPHEVEMRNNGHTEKSKPTVVLADDHLAVRKSVSKLIDQEFEILATAVNGVEAVSAVLRVQPNIIVLDISMPEMDGYDAARAIRKAGLKTKILFLTVHLDSDHIEHAFDAGANGFVLKGRMNRELITAMKETLAGGRFVSKADRNKANRNSASIGE